ncbi:hypothetical protein [Brevibacterium renqingii]|uniref:hypothetical protein n=1 Tax=Brevibacterium renqingii TaxID=2776916 RepID=UPI001AE0C871|nr:hypothetical protein [Brevibacterium renqingii]
MDHTELTEKFFSEKVVTPVVLGMFADDEWDSIAMIRDPKDARRLTARIVVCGEAVEVLLDYPGSTESLLQMQQRLVDEFTSFIEASEFGAHRTSDWEAGAVYGGLWPSAISRPPRPEFHGPADCTLRRLRISARVLRLDRRRCLSAHRRG